MSGDAARRSACATRLTPLSKRGGLRSPLRNRQARAEFRLCVRRASARDGGLRQEWPTNGPLDSLAEPGAARRDNRRTAAIRALSLVDLRALGQDPALDPPAAGPLRAPPTLAPSFDF